MTEFYANGLGHKFYHRWIFREISFSTKTGEQVLLRGANGSGKSTLMRLLAGQLQPSEGELKFIIDGNEIAPEFWYQYISWMGPALEAYTDLSLAEAVKLHFRFKKCLLGSEIEVMEVLQLYKHRDKPLRIFSSGMLQRLKVGLALFSDAKILLLDEATANLDPDNAEYLLDLIQKYQGERILFFATNAKEEFPLFSNQIVL